MTGQGWQGRGSDRRWRRFRARILTRDPECRLRFDRICTKRSTEVHHLDPWTGHPADVPPDRAIGTCQPCNRHASTPTNPDPDPKPWNQP